MPRSLTFSLAAVVALAAAVFAYWQITTPTPSISHSPLAPSPLAPSTRPQRAPAQSPYEKLTDPSVRWEVRVDMLRSMKASSLRDNDIDTLYRLLTYSPAPGQEESWWVTVNEIMEQMRLQAIAPGRFGEEMLAIIHDPAAPEVLRDYAIQHLGQWCSPRGAALGQPSEQDPAIVRQTADSLAAIAADPTLSYTTLPGISLMVLADMKSGGVSPEVIAPAIESLHPWFATALDNNTTNSTGTLTRISAINAVGLLRLETFAPAIRTLATDPATPPDLRLNSIATLGHIGDSTDIPTLSDIAKTDPRLQHAAQAALTKLTARFP